MNRWVAIALVILATSVARQVTAEATGMAAHNSAGRVIYDVVTMLCGAAIAAVILRWR